MSSLPLHLTVNGEEVELHVDPARTLLELLREDLGLPGTKHGCDVGDCGACTILFNDEPRLACITLALECDGANVTTIEGLASRGVLHPIQEAIHSAVASQCGYCTPGIALSLAALLGEVPNPTDEDLRSAIGANICRCTGYTKILQAARQVVEGDTASQLTVKEPG